MSIIKMTDLNLYKKRVFIRADLNVPIKNQKIINDARILAFLPTIEKALKQDAKIMIASHLGRPIEGKYDEKFSLLPIVNYLRDKLPVSIKFIKDYLNGIDFEKNNLVVLENVRFNKGEMKNDEELSKKYAALCDIFVMDAFGTAHRLQASTCGICKFANIACAGPLLTSEFAILEKVLNKPSRPLVAIIGGSKISTKLTILNSLLKRVDQLIVGGGIANTFLAAKGYNIGKSLYEISLVNEAKRLLNNSTCDIILPDDVRVAHECSENAVTSVKLVNNIENHEKIFDLGDISIIKLTKIIKNAKTILWSGPVGMFEFPNFRIATEVIANTIADSEAFSVVGGGDTLAAIDIFNVSNKISYISTGGGAFLEFIGKKELPIVKILKERSQNQILKYK